MKHIVTKAMGIMLALAITLTGIPCAEAQAAAAKPVISSSQTTIQGNSCTVWKGKKVKLTAKSGRKNVTKKCTWKSSKKAVATVSKTGVLTAKKAGTAYVTAKYKGKTSAKLKVVVKKAASSGQTPPTTDEPTPTNPSGQTSPGSATGSHTITYDVNSKDKSDKLSGSGTQSVSGEILKFATTVQPSKGKKFLGWFTAPSGGIQVYETFTPSSNMTLYAHYTDQNVQAVTFNLGCNYGDTYSFMGKIRDIGMYPRDFDWINQTKFTGPMGFDDPDNVQWSHKYIVNSSKTKFTVDDLPQPSVPGYEFAGWYTTDQNVESSADGLDRKGIKIESGQDVDTGVTTLHARFTKKITISFDDFRGGHYDDIVVDSYKSIKECGQRLPTPDIPGATFVGWTMDADNHEYGWSFPIITEDKYFYNCIEWYSNLCSECLAVSKHRRNAIQYCESWCTGHFHTVNDDWHVFEETDHFTLYPVYKYHQIRLSFDPEGGYFPYDAAENWMLVFDDGEDDPFYSHKSIGTLLGTLLGSQPYGRCDIPGHEGEFGFNYGECKTTMPKAERRNYVFDKWMYLDDTGIEREFKFDTILTKTMTVYAKWNPGTCRVYFDPTDGELTQAERNRVGLDGALRYMVTTESTIAKDGKQLPVPVSSEGREFLGWFKDNGDPVTADTKILADTTVFAHWGVLPKDKPVTLKFNSGDGTFVDKGSDGSEVNLKTKTITRSEAFGQFFELDARPDYDFLGWYIVKPNATEPYTDDSFLQKATESTRVNASTMMNDLEEILLVARWKKIEHVSDIMMVDMDRKSVDKDLNQYKIEYDGKDNYTDLGFYATLLPGTVRNEFKNVRWTTSDPNIIYISGNDVVFSGNYFDDFKFGDNLGDVVLTATSIDNPNVSFDIHVTVTGK